MTRTLCRLKSLFDTPLVIPERKTPYVELNAVEWQYSWN